MHLHSLFDYYLSVSRVVSERGRAAYRQRDSSEHRWRLLRMLRSKLNKGN